MKLTEVRRYRIYETPKTCRYQLQKAMDVDVVWDDGYWLASPSDPKHSDRYGTGDSVKKAVRDLIETMDADYQSDIALLKRKPKVLPTANYQLYVKMFFKK